MQVGEGTRGALKEVDRTDEMGTRQPTQLLRVDRKPPEAADSAGCGLSLTEGQSKHLAVLCSLRERNFISDHAFVIQRRMLYRASLPPIPPPATPVEPPVPHRSHWAWRALGIVLPVIAGLGFIGFRTLEPVSPVANPPDPVSDLAAEVDSDPGDVYTVGKAFRLGLYTYTIAGCEATDTLGGQFKPINASRGTEFVVITFTVRNDSVRPRELSTADLKVEDANGVTYGPSQQAASVLRPSFGDGDNWLTDIQPGVTKVMAVAFEVPDASLKTPVKLIIPEQGPFVGRQASVYLKL